MSQILRNRDLRVRYGTTSDSGSHKRSNPASGTAGTNSSGNPLTSGATGVTTFTPVAASLIPERMAAEMSKDAAKRAKYLNFFTFCLENYETDRKQHGLPLKDVALATSYFIGVNYLVHRDKPLSERQILALRKQLTELLKADESFQALSDRTKQETYETMAVMAEVVLVGYGASKQAGNQQALREVQQMARENLENFLGTSIDKLRFTDDGLEF